MAYGARLESVLGATPREFESRILRRAGRATAPPDTGGLRSPAAGAVTGTATSTARATTRPRYAGPAAARRQLRRDRGRRRCSGRARPSRRSAPTDNAATPPWHLHGAPPAWLVTALARGRRLQPQWPRSGSGLSGRWQPQPAAAASPPASSPPPRWPSCRRSARPTRCPTPPYGRMVTTGHDPWTHQPGAAGCDRRSGRARRRGAVAAHPIGLRPDRDRRAGRRLEDRRHQRRADRAAARSGRRGWCSSAPACCCTGWPPTRPGRLRAALLWTANPLLWLQLVAGAHLDVLAAGAVLAAVAVAARSRLAAGALAGVAAAIKAPAGLVWLGLRLVGPAVSPARGHRAGRRRARRRRDRVRRGRRRRAPAAAAAPRAWCRSRRPGDRSPTWPTRPRHGASRHLIGAARAGPVRGRRAGAAPGEPRDPRRVAGRRWPSP